MTSRRILAAVVATFAVATVPVAAGAASPSHGYAWTERSTGTDEQFRGLAPLSKRVAWVSGEKGSVLRTVDGGRTWLDVSPPAARAEGLALRDIEAWADGTAVAMSIGSGTDSRIFRTDNGGRTWTETFRNTDPAAFYDCLAFTAKGVGLAMSDPVDGKFRILRTTDGGRSWSQVSNAGMPPALEGEFGFAASGTCLVSAQRATGNVRGDFWMVSGGATPRIFRTTDAGTTWSVRPAPLRGGDSAGVYSVAFKDRRSGVMVGGDYTAPADGSNAAAWSADGGTRWTLSSRPVSGYRSGVAFDLRSARNVIAVGPNGSDLSTDNGRTWSRFDTTAYDGVQCIRDSCWASGPKGAVGVLSR